MWDWFLPKFFGFDKRFENAVRTVIWCEKSQTALLIHHSRFISGWNMTKVCDHSKGCAYLWKKFYPANICKSLERFQQTLKVEKQILQIAYTPATSWNFCQNEVVRTAFYRKTLRNPHVFLWITESRNILLGMIDNIKAREANLKIGPKALDAILHIRQLANVWNLNIFKGEALRGQGRWVKHVLTQNEQTLTYRWNLDDDYVQILNTGIYTPQWMPCIWSRKPMEFLLETLDILYKRPHAPSVYT